MLSLSLSMVSSILAKEAYALPEGLTQDVAEALDDAMDLICSKLVSTKYGVEVVCNPDGDRNSISIDGQIMGHAEFDRWLAAKEAEESHPTSNPYEEEEMDEDDCEDESDPNVCTLFGNQAPANLPTELDIPLEDLPEGNNLEARIRKYLRKTYKCCLAKNTTMRYVENLNLGGPVHVRDITWGRKLSRSEIEAMEA